MKTKYGFYDIFVKTSAKYPGNVAARVYNDEKKEVKCYTYSEMFGVSEYISQQLRQLHCSRGLIGLVSSINLLVPCVAAAAHKCCTSFVFLDPNERNENAIQELNITCLITITKNHDTVEPTFKKPDIVTKVFGKKISFYNTSPFSPFITPLSVDEHNEAVATHSFIAMTSGSTGDPKRIEVPVHCILPNICDLTTFFNITPTDVIYFSTPLTFDPSMVEILLAWMNGASLLIAPGRIDALFPKDSPHAVTVWQTTPSKFLLYSNVNIRNHILNENSPLKILALGGEPLYGVKRLKELKHPQNRTKLFTLYGVTEMSCWACIAEINLSKIDHDHEVPLGNCLSETQINIELDDPADNKNKKIGKILLSSKTRNCCVLNRVSTKVSGAKRRPIKFVDTGDIGEVKGHGTIYYRGRRDDVVKRFGYKIQLSLIESTCMLCPRITACACIWLPTPKLLVVYFCSESFNSQNLSDFLRCKLDERYWPDKIIRIENMPINSHGKVSKAELHKLLDNTSEAPILITNLKLKFLQQLKTVLSLRTTYDNIKYKTFFDIGGSSFLAITLCNNLSLNDPEFAEFLLPHLLSPSNIIDEIMIMAEQEICKNVTAKEIMKDEPRKRPNKCADEVSSSSYCMSNVSNKKSKMGSSRGSKELVEFIEMWTYDSGKCVDASPSHILAGVNLYVTVGSHSGVVVVADGLTGTIVGEIQLNSRIEAAVSCYPGSSNFPPFGVVGTYDGTVLCFTIETCNEVWRTNTGSMIKSKAVCCQQIAYVASYDGCIRQLDLLMGKVLKSQKLSEQPISADLALAKDEYLIFGSLSGLCAGYHIPSSSLLWQTKLASPIFAAPVVYAEDKYAIFAQVNGEMHCMTVEKGITIWKYCSENGHIFSSILIRDLGPQTHQLVFGCYDKHLYSVMVNNFQPSLDWSADLEAPIYATPCMLSDKLVLAASNDGKLHVITWDQGGIIAQYSLPKETFSSPAAYGDYIFIGCRNDYLYSLRCVVNIDCK